jgi:hypothetical protein
VGEEQRADRAGWRQHRQRRALRPQHAHDADRSVGPDARVLHDLEHALAGQAAAEAVAGVGEAVLVEGAGDVDRCGGRQHGRHRGRQDQRGQRVNGGRNGGDHAADQREVARRGVQPLRLEADPARNRQPREELQGDEEEAQLLHLRPTAC